MYIFSATNNVDKYIDNSFLIIKKKNISYIHTWCIDDNIYRGHHKTLYKNSAILKIQHFRTTSRVNRKIVFKKIKREHK
jgi:hypothetical protein